MICARKMDFHFKWRSFLQITFFIMLQNVVVMSQVPDPGGTPEIINVNYTVSEELPINSPVGTLPILQGYVYHIQDQQSLFNLNANTGQITTKIVIDREKLGGHDTISFFVTGTSSSNTQQHPINVRIKILDINDNFPTFPKSSVTINFLENIKGSQVSLSTATDKDAGNNGNVSNYVIVSRDDDNKFEVLYDTAQYGEVLIVRNIEKLNREERSSYQLNVSVQDHGSPPKFGFLQIFIHVDDANDNPPIFDQSQYKASINESAPNGSLVIHVAASDEDIGVNSQITYSLLDDTGQFQIDPKTGEVTTKATPLVCSQRCDRSVGDFECEPYSCILTISTTDGGSPPLTGRAYVTVKVLDENNHAPMIAIRHFPDGSKDHSAISENQNTPSIVALVTVTDADQGTKISSLSILSGNEKGHFKMVGTTDFQYSSISLISMPDRERISVYNLTIVAVDSGIPPKSSTANLIVYVIDVNDHVPWFSKLDYRITLPETLPIGSFIESLTAHDEDSGQNAALTYSILSGNTNGWFHLNDKTGLLTVGSRMHYNIASTVSMNISVHDGGPTPFYNFTSVTITILDENDQAPKFATSTFNVTIDENKPAGQEILLATATDTDSGLNGSIIYQLHSDVQLKYPNTFSMNSNNGKLTTQKMLDREEVSFYEIKIIAKDQGLQPLSSTATVYLRIHDQNDEKPVFYPKNYYVNFEETNPAKSTVVQVTAIDKDYGINAKLTYTFTTIYPEFSIESDTGIISTTQTLQKSVQSKYTLQVTASDPDPSHVSVNTATVEITVVNSNDVAPTFENLPYSFSITEDSGTISNPISKSVGSVRAVALGKTVQYSIINGDPTGIFDINDVSGSITAVKRVDREMMSEYDLVIVANTDSGNAQTNVHVTINDVNDHAPKFELQSQVIDVAENLPIGMEVYLASAVDLDAGDNSKLRYTLHDSASSGLFKINIDTGMIILDKSLQNLAASKRSYQLTINVTDGGSPTLSSTQQITLQVEDVNDHTPVFVHSGYEVSLKESISVNDQFLKLVAVDGDIGENARVSYNITRGNGEGSFGIFPDGMLYVSSVLDRETKDHYQLTVHATDNGIEHRNSAVNITINVLDDNDNKPLFVNTTYSMSIKENSAAHTIIGSVSASDLDIGRNAEISYYLISGQENFTIDSQTGEIRSLVKFDREKLLEEIGVTFYTVEVKANDNGIEKLEDIATVKIYILDENDNAPVFEKTMYRPKIHENSARYSPVVQVVATDKDEEVNQAITYSIISGNEDGQFNINQANGQITLVGLIDRESQNSYVLKVLASNPGSENQNGATCTVSVTILDVNDNSPLFAQSVYEVALSENHVIGDEIIQFVATDTDLGINAEIVYSVSGGDNHFIIDVNTGRLYLNRGLDYESKHEYKLNISASDKGSPSVMPTYASLTIKIKDENDNVPTFINTPSVASITENANSFQSIMKVSAQDIDSGVNGQITFSILNQEPIQNMFTIDSEQGKISFSGFIDLDRETIASHTITVVATDKNLTSPKSAEKTIVINVMDENDNTPVFLSAKAVKLNYPTTPGQFATVLAEDLDFDNNGRITYSLLTQTNYFSIDPTTGVLSLKTTLPASPGTYTTRVKVTDNGMTPRSKEMDILVILVPTSGNGPQFDSASYSVSVQENEGTGRSLAKVYTSPYLNEKFYIAGINTNGKTGQLFTIDENTGVLSAAAELDREVHGDKIDVTVCAVQPTQSSPKASCTEVSIAVTDLNDTPPKFSRNMYTETVSEGTGIGAGVATITVADPDTVGQVSLIIKSGADGKFTIDNTGKITLTATLDRETKARHTLVIEASDGIQTSTTSVIITVSDINDSPPAFTSLLYTFDVPEDSPVGTTLGRVEAVDPDEGLGGEVYYTLTSSWGSDLFNLDLQKGTFTLLGNLDFEEVQLYTLKVTAEDRGDPKLTSQVTVYMNIKDTNDNEPVFDPMSYSAEVKEDVVIGTSVAMVSATDLDSGLNGEVFYEIFQDEGSDYFGIGPTNGTLFTVKHLDRETTPNYTLTILAVDQAQAPEIRRTTSTQVSINVKDVNDNAPVFLTPAVMSVPEDKQLNSVAFTVKVEDSDEGQNAAVTFSLAHHSGYPFRINPSTGEMLVNTALDRETIPSYTVTVIAFDQGNPSKSSNQALTIKISDINDNAPIFYPVTYTKTIAENTAIGTTLLKVTATDRDEGLNGNVRYFITAGDDNFDFALDPSSGVIRVQKTLHYERVQTYSLKIQAEDSGSTTMSAFADVTISLLDVNDNKPVFVDSPYYALVREEMENLPVHVLEVSARDEDSGINNLVTYKFLEGDKVNGEVLFQINNSSGEITCLKRLDREAVEEYELIVVASDAGSPSLTGTGTITVTVQDINDHAPEFEHSAIYIGHIMENLSGNTPILTVKATDMDAGRNAEILYSLEDTFGDKFAINPTSGQLSAVKSLDREETPLYSLKVVARDNALIPKQVVADVTIIVDDMNDNTPQFEKESYQQTVNNPTQTGEFVLGVTALDRDIGGNGRVVYTLSGSDKLVINAQTGILTANGLLSAPGQTIVCFVKAQDEGDTKRSSTVNVTVTVSDISSSNRPFFTTFPTNPLSLDENTGKGQRLTTVLATSSSGNGVHYYIAGGNVGQSFIVGQTTGDVTVLNPVDYEMTQSFDIWIEASDASNQALSTYRKMVINIQDLNDNTPRFAQPLYSPTVREEEPSGLTVVQIMASDGDSGVNGQLTYRFSSDETAFGIDATTGVITTKTRLDREHIDEYNLVVEAVDQGLQPLTGSTTVRITVLDINDNRPKFTRNFNIEIPEDLAVGSFIIQVTSSDDDIGENARVTYSIIKNPVNNMTNQPLFKIDPTSGNITLLSKLDAELHGGPNRGLQIQITASDRAHATHADVNVYVADVNDNTPQFQQPLRFSLIEGSPEGTTVGKVSATDADIKEQNYKIYYSFKLSSSEFSIDSSSGEIKSKIQMVYIHNQEYPSVNLRELIVVATDHGTPPRSSEAIVHVDITDSNDHAPVFEQRDYYSAVPDNVVIGDHVMSVVAVDKYDYGINAEVEYFKESGSGSSYFYVHKLTGEITIANSLAGQKDKDFNLIVKAQDKGVPSKSVTQEIKFRITGINEHSPVFTTTNHKTTVPENTVIGSSIAMVNAQDNDQTGPNGEISYHIVDGDPNGLFLIDQSRGDISVHRQLDYETNTEHHLTIMAKDQGLYSRNSTIVYTVQVSDVNDNAPVFNDTHFTASVYENTPSDVVITTISARDADTGQNAIIEYMFGVTASSSLFTIDRLWGTIKTSAALDYEQTSEYDLVVIATNPGTQLRNTTQVTIQVKGVNEFYPRFVQKNYPFSIKESIPINTVLGSVLATDDDHGEDGVVYYYLIGSSNTKGFKLDHKSGEIIVSGRPDYESSPTIVLTVMAKNWGSIQGGDTDECTISITIEDANDPPVFSKPLYNATVLENSGSGVGIVQVAATDTDHNPSDQEFTFRIEDGNDMNLFSIDSLSGWIKTTGQGVLDREARPVYNITVAAVDKGTVPQTGTAMVQINLLDMNDNGPIFTTNNVTGYILENQNNEVTVMSLYDFTTDPDLPPNQDPYRYRLQGTSNYFLLNEVSGVITSKAPIDREQNPRFELGVLVSDGGSPTQTSTLTFTVEVKDQNDEPSQPRKMKIQVALFGNRLPAQPVADVRPLDKDLVGNYTCDINSQQSIFAIASGRCRLSMISYPDISSPMIVSFSGSDGLHDKVSYNADISFLRFDNQTLSKTVILRIQDISAENFVQSKLTNMHQMLTGLLGQAYEVVIYNVESFSSDSLVYIAVKGQDGTYLLHDILKQQIVNKKTDIENEIGIIVTAVGYTPCTATTCRSGECLNHIDVHSGMNVVDTDHLIVSSPNLLVSYQCSCPPQFTGTHCETPVSPCGSGHCQNNGFCINDQNGNPVCDCPSGWKGPFCEIDVNECVTSPCQNNSMCNNTLGSFTCTCRDGFTGTLCEQGSDRCSPNPCVQGTCKNLVGGYKCECPFKYWGDKCQFSTYGFSTSSYMQFSSPSSSNDNTFDVTLATLKSRALILYNPAEKIESSEFLALEIIDGYVRFSFNLGDIVTSRVTVPKNISTGEWFRIQVHRSGELAQLRVSSCPSGGGVCPECYDPSCVRSASQTSRKLNLDDQPVTIGGLESLDVALQRPSQIETHDFVGCMREFLINNVDYLRDKSPLKEQGVDKNGCSRQRGVSLCSSEVCHNSGVCVDEWDSYSCRCNEGFHGNKCQQEFKPFGFGASGYVTFKQKETYQRDVLVSQSRRKRATGTSSIFIRFRTTGTGLLFYADRGTSSSALYIEGKFLKYTITDNNMDTTVEVPDSSINDGYWHNASVIVTGTTVLVMLDGVTASKDNVQSSFPFSDVYITQMSLGGSANPVTVGSSELSGFGGCISEFELDEKPVPLNGTTNRFVIETSPGVENGCSGLCTSCSGPCTVSGEVAVCKMAKADEPLGIGVIVVIAFFGVLLIVIIVIFLVYRFHRQRREAAGKQNGHVNKTFGSGHSPEDSGYGENDFIQQHVNHGLKSSTHYAVSNGHLANRPDLINANGRTSALEMGDGTVIIDNGDFNPPNEERPELYDLDNASSIAPSDIDVSYYYGARHGKGTSYRDNYKKHLLAKNGPTQNWNGTRESPGALKRQNAAAMQNRHSPANILGPHYLGPNNRNSPSPYGNRLSPMNQVNRQSPHVRSSPLTHSNSRGGTPMSGVHHGRADSDHSIVSHHSHHSISSTSSASRLPPMPNGHLNHGRAKKPLPPSRGSKPVKGLTIEEVEKLNARPTRPSPVSMLEAVSSSTEGNPRQQPHFKIRDHLDDGAMLEPLDSSSDESANDSFTCSEFEYENDKNARNDFDPNAMIYSKLAEVDNETEDFNANYNLRNKDGLDSNGSSFASSEEGRRNGAPLNDAIDLNFFTDWGPSFEKLVGVFKDIASLPDGDGTMNSNMDCRTETEEYV